MSYLDETARKQLEELLKTDPVLIDYMKPRNTSEYHRKMMIYGNAFIESEQMLCLGCGKSVIGDPKYHQVYSFGSLQGYRHRKCRVNYCKYGSVLKHGDICEDTYMGCMHKRNSI